MIQDIAPHIYHNEYRPVEPDADSYLMYFEKHNALANWDGEEIAFPRFRDFPEVSTELSENVIYLFTVDDQRFYLVKELAPGARASGWRVTGDFGTHSPSGCPLPASPAISFGTGTTSVSIAAIAEALWCMTRKNA